MNPYATVDVPALEKRDLTGIVILGFLIVLVSVFFGVMFLLLPLSLRDALATWNRSPSFDEMPLKVSGSRFTVANAQRGLIVGCLCVLPSILGTLLTRDHRRTFVASLILTIAMFVLSATTITLVVYDAFVVV